MGTLFGSTFKIVSRRIGNGGTKNHADVRRVNELLRLAGYLKSAADAGKDRQWTDATVKALKPLVDLMRRMGDPVYAGTYNGEYLDPELHKSLLCFLADEAGVLIRLPHRKKGKEAVLELFETCQRKKYPYCYVQGDSSSVRTIWGLEDYAHVAISTSTDKFFAASRPVGLNCTSFANLMLSVWMWGNAHRQPYDASQMVGGYDPLGDRYNMHGLNKGIIHEGFVWFGNDKPKKGSPKGALGESVIQAHDAIIAAVQPERLYYAASCDEASAMITHDMVLFGGDLYECNKDASPAVYRTPLIRRMQKMATAGKILYLAGPSCP